MKVVGKVTEEEGQRIQDIYERKMALDNLLMILDEKRDEKMRKEVLVEKQVCEQEYENWWFDMYSKYNWDKIIDVTKETLLFDFRKKSAYVEE